MTCLNSWTVATRLNTRIDGTLKLLGKLPTKVRDNRKTLTRTVARRIFIFLHLLSVGGIYTVIRSKAYVSTEEMGDQFCLIGPYKEQSARTEVEEADFPSHSPLHQAVQVLRDQGYKVSSIRENVSVSAFFVKPTPIPNRSSRGFTRHHLCLSMTIYSVSF